MKDKPTKEEIITEALAAAGILGIVAALSWLFCEAYTNYYNLPQ